MPSLSSGNWNFPFTLYSIMPISFRIRKAVKERQSMTVEMSAEVNEATHGQQKKDKNMAIVLICIVVMFILCQSLKIIPDIFEAFFCDHSNDTSACQSPFSLEILISVSHLMLAVNSASNFLIYMLRGDKFRQFFFQIFFKCQCTRASRRSKEANRYRNSTVHYKSSTIKTTSAIIILEDELIERSPTTPKNWTLFQIKILFQQKYSLWTWHVFFKILSTYRTKLLNVKSSLKSDCETVFVYFSAPFKAWSVIIFFWALKQIIQKQLPLINRRHKWWQRRVKKRLWAVHRLGRKWCSRVPSA